MKYYDSLIYLIPLLIAFNGGFAQIAINFPTDPPLFTSPAPKHIGSPCETLAVNQGTCQPFSQCREVRDKIRRNELLLRDVNCYGPHAGFGDSLVCCPLKNGNVAGELADISPPEGIYDQCGVPWIDFSDTDLRDIYRGNNTAEAFKAKGFSVTVRELYLDQINVFDYTNGSHSGTWSIGEQYGGVGYGGINARRVLAVYMALLGTSEGWLCDGALINSQWVLTAAHCFDDQSLTIVRLGEYDLSDDTVKSTEVPLDFSVSKVVIYPEYSFPSSYHDLALVKLNKRIPQLRPDLSPVCLPWAEESLTDLVGRLVTLTGWGASVFLGPNTPILQEVNVTVFGSSVCDRSYSTLQDYRSNFPNGIREETSLCAGDELGGKDACQGDSGGPIVYLDSSNRYTLAGIVSTGNGCGLKEFPGIYVPLHNPKYLSWIKRVAF